MANVFMNYTTGLLASKNGEAMLVKVEYSKNKDGGVTLQVVSGRNLEKTSGKKALSRQEFDDRPTDPYDSIVEAKWALAQCGWTISTAAVEE